MGRSTSRRMLTGPKLPDPAEQVDGRRLRARRFSYDARASLKHVWALVGMNRPGMSGDSICWEGWSHARKHVEEVPAGVA